MTEEKSYRESHLKKGEDYHEKFSENPHRRMIWNLEQQILDDIYHRLLSKYPPEAHLDFACGTGRILNHFSGRFDIACGVDVSSSMLQVARQNVPSAKFIEGDLTRRDILHGRQFDLITAFRFFPNAEASLRADVINALKSHLKPQGILVFNNHKNLGSSLRRLAGLIGKTMGQGMSFKDVTDFLDRASLKIVEEHPLGILPITENMGANVVRLAANIEPLLGHLSGAATIAQNIIYVCQRND